MLEGGKNKLGVQRMFAADLPSLLQVSAAPEQGRLSLTSARDNRASCRFSHAGLISTHCCCVGPLTGKSQC